MPTLAEKYSGLIKHMRLLLDQLELQLSEVSETPPYDHYSLMLHYTEAINTITAIQTIDSIKLD